MFDSPSTTDEELIRKSKWSAPTNLAGTLFTAIFLASALSWALFQSRREPGEGDSNSVKHELFIELNAIDAELQQIEADDEAIAAHVRNARGRCDRAIRRIRGAYHEPW